MNNVRWVLAFFLFFIGFGGLQAEKSPHDISCFILSKHGKEVPCTKWNQDKTLDDASHGLIDDNYGEDRGFYFQMGQTTLMGVFDGVGGTKNKPALRIFIAKLIASLSSTFMMFNTDEITEDSLSDILLDSLKRIDSSHLNPNDGGATTLSLAIVNDAQVHYLLIGDSPLYFVQKSESMVTILEGMSYLFNMPHYIPIVAFDGDEILSHAVKGKFDLMDGDRVILASDGISDNLTVEHLSPIFLNDSFQVKEVFDHLQNIALNPDAKSPYKNPFYSQYHMCLTRFINGDFYGKEANCIWDNPRWYAMFLQREKSGRFNLKSALQEMKDSLSTLKVDDQSIMVLNYSK